MARAAGRRGHRPQSAEDRGRRRQCAGVPGGAEGVRQLRRVHLAASSAAGRCRTAGGTPADVPARDRGIRRDEQRSREARLPLRRLDDLLRVHAGDRHGERSPDRTASATRSCDEAADARRGRAAADARAEKRAARRGFPQGDPADPARQGGHLRPGGRRRRIPALPPACGRAAAARATAICPGSA